AEERPYLGAPRHHRELVDGGDHHRRRPVVDLLVDELHRQAGMRVAARLRLTELALRELVAAVDGGAPGGLVDLDVAPRLNLGAAPGAARELRWRRDASAVPVLVADGFDGLV